MHIFSQPSHSWTNGYIYFIRLRPCLFEPSILLYWDSKTFPNGTVLYLGLAKQCLLIFLHKLFEYFTAWNSRCDRNRIIIIFWTFKTYINFLPFVRVSTWSVWLMLPISITQLSNKIIDSIESLMLLLILLEQSNHLLSNTFNMSLQSMIIRKIRHPSIFKVFIEVN